jgi:hypothetical protein
MPLPANTTTVVVLGTFNTPEGNPSTGTITFTPSAWLLNSGANIAIPNSAVSKSLGTAGDFSVTLPITDDADLSPNPFIYSVSEVIDGVSQSYNISIPGTVASGGTVYLADLAPVAAAGPEYYSLASSLAIGTVTTLAAGSAATATITGLAPSQTLDLGIPTGSTGATGTAATVTVGTIGATAYPGPGTVTNSGTSGAAVLDFVLVTGQTGATGPQGNTGTLAVGTVGSVPNSGTASVTNVGSSTAGTFDFILRDGPTGPQGATGATGAQGPTATLAVGTVGSVPNSGTASVTNVGSSSAGTFDFVLRDGPTGPQGATGTAATVTLGTVGFVDYPGPGTVTNSGTSGSAVLDFILVRGPQGAIGDLTAAAPLRYIGSEFGLNVGSGLETVGTTLAANFSDANPANLGAAASAGTSVELARGDHVHARPSAADIGAVGTATTITAGTALAGGGDLSASRTLDVVLASTNPAALGTAAPGTATASVARSDHVHAMPSASDVGAVANSVVTAKGDLLAATGSAAITRLGVGTNGHILTADSVEATGMKWAAAPVSLPSQTSNGGKLLTTDGSSASWTNLLSQLISVGPMERFNVVASAATGTVNIDIKTAAVWYYTTNATANHTINFRGDSSTTLSSLLAVEDAYTVGWIINNGTTAYYPTTIQVDGTAVTPKWLNNSAPPSSSQANQTAGIDAFTLTVIKTASTPTYTVLGSWAQYR